MGKTWTYDRHYSAGGPSDGTGLPNPLTVSVTGTRTVDAATAYELTNNGLVYQVAMKTASDVRWYEGGARGPVAGPLVLLKLPVRIGDQWEFHKTVPFDAEPTLPLQVDVQTAVVRFEDLVTPVGVLTTVVVVSTETDTLTTLCDLDPRCYHKYVETDWYAPGIGLVKRTVTDLANFNSPDLWSFTETLKSYGP